ncbi:TPA: oxidoreductase, partial [Candidatus Poribacteria bacterium]|nr:oxidoreductase [Candidatus Poribacteria bacterium]
TVPGVGEAPFTPSSSPYEKEKMELTVMRVGRVTSALHSLKPGDLVGIRGPFGNGYPIERFYGKEVLVVGGGVGGAPLRSLLYTLFKEIDKFKKVCYKYGARTPKDLVYKYCFDEWSRIEKVDLHLTVDVGDESWTGRVGVVTVLLEELDKEMDIPNSVAVVCGPPIMMRFVTLRLLEVGYSPDRIYLSMERNMSCGLGKCGHCMLGRYYVCKDGPVFSYDMIKDLKDVFD